MRRHLIWDWHKRFFDQHTEQRPKIYNCVLYYSFKNKGVMKPYSIHKATFISPFFSFLVLSSVLLWSLLHLDRQEIHILLSTKTRLYIISCAMFKHLKGLFHPACLARAVSWLAFVVAIFMAHENDDNKGQRGDRTCKECWMKHIL